MGLAETQHVLARLYMDASFRSRFFADPAACGREAGLESDEAARLAQLSRERLHLFVQTLAWKRWDEMCALLPLTSRVFGSQLADLFADYVTESPASETAERRQDAIGLSEFIRRRIAASHVAPSWVAELARYEASWIRASIPQTRCMVRWFRHQGEAMARAALCPAEVPPFQPTLSVWIRPVQDASVRYCSVSVPAFQQGRLPARGEWP